MRFPPQAEKRQMLTPKIYYLYRQLSESETKFYKKLFEQLSKASEGQDTCQKVKLVSTWIVSKNGPQVVCFLELYQDKALVISLTRPQRRIETLNSHKKVLPKKAAWELHVRASLIAQKAWNPISILRWGAQINLGFPLIWLVLEWKKQG